MKLSGLFGTSAEELGLFGNAEGEAPAALLSSGSSSSPMPHGPGVAPGEPTPVWLIPYPRNPYFTGREDLLEQVEQHLTPRPSGETTVTDFTALPQSLALKAWLASARRRLWSNMPTVHASVGR